MRTGKIKWFDETKGYGFIVPDDGGEDVFVHITQVKKSDCSPLETDQKVSFELDPERRKPSACNITKV